MGIIYEARGALLKLCDTVEISGLGRFRRSTGDRYGTYTFLYVIRDTTASSSGLTSRAHFAIWINRRTCPPHSFRPHQK